MRPVRLEVEGFTTFRGPTVLDFGGVELFALSGPTGSGKTSVLDAIVFALYGSIPRLPERAVAPVVAQGMAEARVRLDFRVGPTTYTATRVVRVRKARANTDEARLEEAGGTVMAGNADEVTAAVERLLGLSYRHFTRCIVLPQGDFARFLHDAPRDRQELLVSLLDLGLYGRIAGLAGQRAGAAKAEVTGLEAQIGRLAHATPDAVDAADERVRVLGALVREIDAVLPGLVALEAAATDAAATAAQLRDEADRLGRVRVPDGLDALSSAASTSREEVEAARAALAGCEAAVAAAEKRLAGAGDPTALTGLLTDLDQRAALVERRTKGGQILADRLADAEAAGCDLASAEATMQAATDELRRAEAAHRAHAVRADLVAGEPCPVCEQPVAVVPSGRAPPALSKARRVLDKAERDARQARVADQAAGQQVARRRRPWPASWTNWPRSSAAWSARRPVLTSSPGSTRRSRPPPPSPRRGWRRQPPVRATPLPQMRSPPSSSALPPRGSCSTRRGTPWPPSVRRRVSDGARDWRTSGRRSPVGPRRRQPPVGAPPTSTPPERGR